MLAKEEAFEADPEFSSEQSIKFFDRIHRKMEAVSFFFTYPKFIRFVLFHISQMNGCIANAAMRHHDDVEFLPK